MRTSSGAKELAGQRHLEQPSLDHGIFFSALREQGGQARRRDRGQVDVLALRGAGEVEFFGHGEKAAEIVQLHASAAHLAVHRMTTTKFHHLIAYLVTNRRRGTATGLLCIQHIAQPASELFAFGHAEAAGGHGGRADAKT